MLLEERNLELNQANQRIRELEQEIKSHVDERCFILKKIGCMASSRPLATEVVTLKDELLELQLACQKMREALKIAINTVECASLDKDGTELPWYKAAKEALRIAEEKFGIK